MSGGLEVFLISSYYSRRRSTASGLKISAPGPTPTIWRNYLFAEGSLTDSSRPPMGFSWSVVSESSDVHIDRHSFCARVASRSDELCQPLVIIGDYKEGLYHYTMQIWNCNQVTLELTEKLYESKISSPQAFWLLHPNHERQKYADPYQNFAKRMIKLGNMTKLQYFNKYQGYFRLVITSDFLMFEDAFGSGINYHWRMTLPKQNMSVYLHRSVDQVALSIILVCVFQQDSTCASASLKKTGYIRRDLVLITNLACDKLVSQKQPLLLRHHAQLILLILDYFVKPLVDDWDQQTADFRDTLKFINAVAIEYSTAGMTFLQEQLPNLNFSSLRQLIVRILETHVKFEPKDSNDPWRKSIEALELEKLKDWFLQARNPETARTHGLLWRFKMYSPQFFIDFFCQHLSTGPAELDLKKEVFFSSNKTPRLLKETLTNIQDGQQQILQIGELRLISRNYWLAVYDSQDKYLVRKNTYSFAKLINHGDYVFVLHQPYQDGQLISIEHSVQRRKFQELWLSSLYSGQTPELQGASTSTGGQPGGEFLTVVGWKDKQPLGGSILGAYTMAPAAPGYFAPRIDKRSFTTLEKLGLEAELAAHVVERRGISYYNRNTSTMIFGSFGVYRIIYSDESETQKWILACLEIKLNKSGLTLENRGLLLLEGKLPLSGHNRHAGLKGFTFGKKFVLIQVEVDYTITFFTVYRNKLITAQKFKNNSSLVKHHLRLDPTMGINIYWGQVKNKAVFCMVYTGPKGQKSSKPATERPWLIRVVSLCFK